MPQRTRIIVLSIQTDQPPASEALQQDADGCAARNSLAHELIGAVPAIISGKTYHSEQLHVCELNSAGDNSFPGMSGLGGTLTAREREILSLVARGLANKEIAARLSISIRTVEAHRSKIMRKLNIHNHAGLIHFAMRRDILCLS